MSFVSVLLFVPLLAFIAIIFKVPARQAALGASLLNLFVSFWIYFQYDPKIQGFQFVQDIRWIQLPGLPEIHYHVGVDGMNLPLILLTTIVTLAAIIVAPEGIKRESEFYSYLLAISLGAIGAFVSLDLFFFYIFHEFALIPTFLLIGIWGSENRQFVSLQITLYLMVGSLVLLVGILALLVLLPQEARTFDIPRLIDYAKAHPLPISKEAVPFAFLLVGFGTLVSLFPFYTWAPAGYAVAPTPAAMLHAGVLKKFGLYGLLRVAIPLLPGGLEHWKSWLYILLLGNILYIGYVTIVQKELTTMLGYSSVMHMGYIFLGLASWNKIGISGVVVLMVAHGLSIALLFALAGEIKDRTGEIKFSELGGLGQRMPFISVAFVLASFASIGVPGLANFTGELLIFFGSWQAQPWITALAIWGIVISAVYQLRAVQSVFFGKLPAHLKDVEDLQGLAKKFPYLLLMASLLIIGMMPSSLLSVIKPTVEHYFSTN
ncbi:NADH dehydrogenase [Methylacidiphilum sp. Yel]|uniref:complex I subunit 4 family protein n=1 Tax=Methylacidiphilum sp. Yel TaxID=1847730 RepID=UPI00106AFCE1|nr:NADH-quinone oxidoreductase subunit M [Methylacidiphilum sp. Yel]TFE70281.1 NADH dehydrogenase [Methylacidiphilum sp. Yel]